jgi:hypothetical protein
MYARQKWKITFLSGNIKEGDSLEDIGIDSRIISKLILQKLGMKWLRLMENGVNMRAR